MFLFKIYYILVFFRLFIFIANITIHFNLFRFYWKYFSIVLPFLLNSLDENKFVYCNKLLAFSMISINPIQNYPHIIESYACIL